MNEPEPEPTCSRGEIECVAVTVQNSVHSVDSLVVRVTFEFDQEPQNPNSPNREPRTYFTGGIVRPGHTLLFTIPAVGTERIRPPNMKMQRARDYLQKPPIEWKDGVLSNVEYKKAVNDKWVINQRCMCGNVITVTLNAPPNPDEEKTVTNTMTQDLYDYLARFSPQQQLQKLDGTILAITRDPDIPLDSKDENYDIDGLLYNVELGTELRPPATRPGHWFRVPREDLVTPPYFQLKAAPDFQTFSLIRLSTGEPVKIGGFGVREWTQFQIGSFWPAQPFDPIPQQANIGVSFGVFGAQLWVDRTQNTTAEDPVTLPTRADYMNSIVSAFWAIRLFPESFRREFLEAQPSARATCCTGRINVQTTAPLSGAIHTAVCLGTNYEIGVSGPSRACDEFMRDQWCKPDEKTGDVPQDRRVICGCFPTVKSEEALLERVLEALGDSPFGHQARRCLVPACAEGLAYVPAEERNARCTNVCAQVQSAIAAGAFTEVNISGDQQLKCAIKTGETQQQSEFRLIAYILFGVSSLLVLLSLLAIGKTRAYYIAAGTLGGLGVIGFAAAGILLNIAGGSS